jgi:hypothetical protein
MVEVAGVPDEKGRILPGTAPTKSASPPIPGIRRTAASRHAVASNLLLEIDNHAEIAGFCLSVRDVEALRRQTPAQQFANRRRPARHMAAEPPLIEGGKLL